MVHCTVRIPQLGLKYEGTLFTTLAFRSKHFCSTYDGAGCHRTIVLQLSLRPDQYQFRYIWLTLRSSGDFIANRKYSWRENSKEERVFGDLVSRRPIMSLWYLLRTLTGRASFVQTIFPDLVADSDHDEISKSFHSQRLSSRQKYSVLPLFDLLFKNATYLVFFIIVPCIYD